MNTKPENLTMIMGFIFALVGAFFVSSEDGSFTRILLILTLGFGQLLIVTALFLQIRRKKKSIKND